VLCVFPTLEEEREEEEKRSGKKELIDKERALGSLY